MARIPELARRRSDGIVGLNRRDLWIQTGNPRARAHGADDKLATKAALAAAGIPTAPTIAALRDRRALAAFGLSRLPDAWAVKPNRGRRGTGIVLAIERRDGGWRTPSGTLVTNTKLVQHMRKILTGEFSLDGEADAVLVEPLLQPAPFLARLVAAGLPDVRVVCRGGRPLLAMLRLPTTRSGGRANLHQGAIGAGVDIDSGEVRRARWGRRALSRHPDTNEEIVGLQLPHWDTIVAAALRCSEATGLGLIGADIVITETGPLVLEVNARPGLEIQNVNERGLAATAQKPPARRFVHGRATRVREAGAAQA